MTNSQKSKISNAVLIGAGRISRSYQAGLAASEDLCLRAIIDINPHAPGFELFPDAERFYSLNALRTLRDIDFAVISTPPASHAAIIRKCLNNRLSVIVEKPLTPSSGSISGLYRLAAEKGLTLNTAYHWQFGEEIVAFNASCDPRKITEISVDISDPYSSNGRSINDNRLDLCGTWIDSGVNALSMIKTWLPFDNVKILSTDSIQAENASLPIFCRVQLLIDGVKVSICIDWRKQLDFKVSTLKYDGKKIVIDHSRQTVSDGESISAYDSMPRLPRHYYNYFTSRRYLTSNEEETLKIHNVLMKVKNLYAKTYS